MMKPGALLLEMPRGERDQRHRAGEVLIDRRERRVRIDLRRVLVAERAEAYDDAVESAELASPRDG